MPAAADFCANYGIRDRHYTASPQEMDAALAIAMRKPNPLRGLSIAACAVALAAMLAPGAHGQAFPTRPINVIDNNTPGSGPDVMGRLMAGEAAKLLGQPLVYENRTGANGRLVLAALKAAAGDGHVLGLVSDGLVVSQPIADPGLQLEVGKDYEAVSVLFESPFVLVSRPALPFNDLKGTSINPIFDKE